MAILPLVVELNLVKCRAEDWLSSDYPGANVRLLLSVEESDVSKQMTMMRCIYYYMRELAHDCGSWSWA